MDDQNEEVVMSPLLVMNAEDNPMFDIELWRVDSNEDLVLEQASGRGGPPDQVQLDQQQLASLYQFLSLHFAAPSSGEVMPTCH